MTWDVVVIGGAFAGLSAAAAAAERGASVLVLERNRRAGERLHTTGLLCPDSVDVLDLPARLLGPRLDRFDLRSPRGGRACVERAGAGFTATDTPGVLEALERRARDAGAVIRHGVLVRGAREDASGAVVTTSSGEAIASRRVVAAGGVVPVGRRAGRAASQRVLAGLEHHVEAHAGELDPTAMTLLLHRRWAPGYACWAFRGVEGVWQVGVLGLLRRGESPARALAAFMAWLSRSAGFEPSRAIASRGGLVPVGGAVRAPRAPSRIVAVGDAAGHVSSLTAGGIGRAAQAGADVGAALALGSEDAVAAALARAASRAGRHRCALRRLFELTLVPGAEEAAVRVAALAPAAVAELLFRRHPEARRLAAVRPEPLPSAARR